jgi:DNA-directed RNA polymerase specialized sigma24 family protein
VCSPVESPPDGGARGRLVGQLFALTGDLHDAEDLVQEAFARAAADWKRIRAYEVPEAWVRRVAFNLAHNRGRRLKRHAAALVRLGRPPEGPTHVGGPGRPGHRAQGPADAAA